MPKKIIIPDQAEVLATFDALSAEATRLEKLAGANAPNRPVATGTDLLADCEALEAHNAVLSVTTRLASPQSHQAAKAATSPTSAPAFTKVALIASAPTGFQGAAISTKPAAKLTATDRARIALGLPLPSPRSPLTGTQKVLAHQAAKAAKVSVVP